MAWRPERLFKTDELGHFAAQLGDFTFDPKSVMSTLTPDQTAASFPVVTLKGSGDIGRAWSRINVFLTISNNSNWPKQTWLTDQNLERTPNLLRWHSGRGPKKT
ncbi:hypothetical protein Q31b_50780 [Novipirellula aureliae]|uniref:Uncharacterized protein n=1 Tax=Novipirellula aureliae TaxID=2527966 RepID=A0A5C6DEJ7_9BACT|nr:hypothetical protein [Novipirellula aureliae]TWU35643.1 hypothetical protein Q31b_50780 [Novipirellula aureliae]